MFDANFLSHFEHFQIPFESLLTPSFSQKGQDCFILCFDSTFTNLDLTDLPYLAPNLPADLVFLSFVAMRGPRDYIIIGESWFLKVCVCLGKGIKIKT